MRRSIVAALLMVFVTGGLVFSSSLPRGYAQVAGPQGDEFNSSSFTAPFVAVCGHNATQPCPDAQGAMTWSLNTDSPGKLRIWTQFGSLIGPSTVSNNARNMILQPVNSLSDYVVTTSMYFPAAAVAGAQQLGQTAGLLVYQDDDNFIYLGRDLAQNNPSRIEFVQEINGASVINFVPESSVPVQPIYLRIQKVGTLYEGSYSTDNVNFTPIAPGLPATATPTATATGTSTATPGATPTNTPGPAGYTATYSTPQIGLFAWGGTNPQVTNSLAAADFDWFRVGTNSMTPGPTAGPTSTNTPIATNTTTPGATATSTLTPTPTATSTATPTVLAPTATSTPQPTPTPVPPRPYVLRFQYVSLWYHVVRRGTYDHIQIQANHRSRLGIWAHVIFPNGRHFDYYTNTNSQGFWAQNFSIPYNVLSRHSNQGQVTLQLWHGRSTRKTFVTFTIL